MMMTILQKIPIDNKYLYRNVREHLLEKTKTMMEGTCSKENGYIIEVKEIEEIIDNIIAPATSTVFFTVKYRANILKPVIGEVVKGKICMIFQYGIFVDIMNIMKILIPATSMDNFEYNNNEYDDNKGNVLSKGKEVSIKIISFKYEDKQFSCIGDIIL